MGPGEMLQLCIFGQDGDGLLSLTVEANGQRISGPTSAITQNETSRWESLCSARLNLSFLSGSASSSRLGV